MVLLPLDVGNCRLTVNSSISALAAMCLMSDQLQLQLLDLLGCSVNSTPRERWDDDVDRALTSFFGNLFAVHTHMLNSTQRPSLSGMGNE